MSNLLLYVMRIVQVEEGWSGVPYYDTLRYPTMGWGFKVGNKGDPLPNLTIDREEGDAQLYTELKALDEKFRNHRTTNRIYPALSDVRKAALISMAYQLGFTGLLGFPRMWACLAMEDYSRAALAALDSKVAREQAPARWRRNASMIRDDKLHPYYGVL